MRLPIAIRRILCKLGLHVHRVYGHCFDKEDQKFEYYYNCVICGNGFWDYATKMYDDGEVSVEYVSL